MSEHQHRVEQIELEHGPLNVVRMGSGPAVVLLHQTPRSWDEYRDVLPHLAAAGYTAVAIDTPGFGDSAPVPGEASIEAWARAVHGALDELGIDRAAVAGHHTGGSIAVELARQRPERVVALVLSSTSLTDAEYRATPPDESSVDAGHDAESLRGSRADFYPDDRPDLLDRYVADALRAGHHARIGHHVVASYEMEHALAKLTMPVLLVAATHDPYAYPQLERLRAALPHAESIEIAGGMVPLPDGWPEEFASAVLPFLEAEYRLIMDQMSK
jgi:pimeloyl-ACP methyl ester carboxylesterase